MLRFTAFAVLFACAGCRREVPTRAPDPRTDPFSVVLSEFPAEPDQPPALDGDTLLVRVQYAGGCSDHAFALAADARGDTTVLALRHDAAGDACEALVYDELRLALPEPLPGAGPVVLRNPQGGPPFRLR